MAKRSRQSFLKRQRERQRSEKAALKRQKRLARKHGEALEGLEDDSLGEPRGVSLSEFGADPAPDPAAAPDVPQENPAVVETIPSKQD